MLIDHLVYAAPALAVAVAEIEERFGVRAQAGGRHIGLTPPLMALGADVEIRPAAAAGLVARLNGPNGSRVLR